MDFKLDALAGLLIKCLVGIFLLSNVCNHLKALLHQILFDHVKTLVLLESLTRNVETQIVRVGNTLDEIQLFRHEVIAVIHDEDTADVQLDAVALLHP